MKVSTWHVGNVVVEKCSRMSSSSHFLLHRGPPFLLLRSLSSTVRLSRPSSSSSSSSSSSPFRRRPRCSYRKQQQQVLHQYHHHSERGNSGFLNSSSTLVISTILPDPTASAAGVRTQSLLDGLVGLSSSSNVHMMTTTNVMSTTTTSTTKTTGTTTSHPQGSLTASTTGQEIVKDLARKGISWSYIPPNRSNQIHHEEIVRHFQQATTSTTTPLANNTTTSIDRIIFDRFYVEELFSFVFQTEFPNASLILDMQDMHSLRKDRERLVQEWDMKYCSNVSKASTSSTHSSSSSSHPKQQQQQQQQQYDWFGVLPSVMEHVPTLTESLVHHKSDGSSRSSSSKKNDDSMLLRELGSIHRCDLTLVCSTYEYDLLTTIYGIPPSKLCLAPFFVSPSSIRSSTTTTTINNEEYQQQEHKEQQQQQQHRFHGDSDDEGRLLLLRQSSPTFVFCGGFKHTPNVDAVHLLLNILWPQVRRILPTATLHIYGAYCPSTLRQCHHHPQLTGVSIHGYIPNLESIFQPGKILLAPLRFGAGLKGKIVDAWTNGMPIVTTPIGSEGLMMNPTTSSSTNSTEETTTISSSSFGGRVVWSIDDFVQAAVELAVDRTAYDEAVRTGQEILKCTQDQETNWAIVEAALTSTTKELIQRRRQDYTRALLWHHNARSTEYFSRWIELKETMKKNDNPPST